MRVAVTAAALRCALGETPAQAWSRVRAGESGLAPITTFDASGFGDPKAAVLWTSPDGPEDDPALRILGSHGRILDAVAREAHDAAGFGALARERVGLFAGMGMVDAPVHDLAAAALASRRGGQPLTLDAFFRGGYRAVHPLWPLSMLGNVAVGQVSIDLDLRGDNLVLSSEADAGLRAVLEGARSVQSGACDAALVGGASGRVTPQALARLALQERLGPVEPGEGGAMLALARDGAALAYVAGGGSAYGRSLLGSGPDAEAWARALRAALAEADAAAASIDLVFLHAEGLREADLAEEEALADVGLGEAATVRTKEALGHATAGAGPVDLALATAALGSDARRVLVLASGPLGGASALVLEAA